MTKDLEQNSEFRIKYPRGELGQSSGEAELFMLVEHLAGVLDEVDKEVKSMRNNAVNIEFLKDRTKKLTEDVEKLIRNGSRSTLMVEIVFALLLLQDHKIIEHRYHDSLQSCLKSKRYAMKDKSSKDRVVYKCIKSKANIEIYMGEKKITSLILD